MDQLALLSLFIFLAACLYSSVGHAGASGYLAAMAVMNVAPAEMKPAALVLNILVGLIGTFRFYRAGCFSWSVFLPFAIGSIPFAFWGGSITISGTLYKQIVGVILIVAAVRLFVRARVPTTSTPRKTVPFALAVVCGAVIGFLSGLTGTGGGIFLTPLLLFMGWAETRESAGVSVAFILVNSVAGILGHFSRISGLPSAIPYWALAAICGGLLGTEFGTRRFGNATLQRLLAVVLVIAGGKLMFVQ